MAGGVILPGEEDELFQEPILNGDEALLEEVPEEIGGIDPEEYQNLIAAGISSAEDYVDTWLSPDRELAARYYNGEPFGNEVEGRSAVVATETRDAILAMMPGLLRIFCGTTNAVEFESNPGTPSEQADQQTESVKHVIFRDNPGFDICHDAMKDALQKKTGIFTWGWEEREIITATRFTDLPDDALTLLELEATDQSDSDIGIVYDVQVEDRRPDQTQPGGDMMADVFRSASPEDMAQAGLDSPMLSSGVVRRRNIRKRVKIEAVPPEEFIATPSATRDLDRFRLVGRRQRLPIGELVALGHDEEAIREAVGGSGDGGGAVMETNPEATHRAQGAGVERLFDVGFESADPASEMVKYCVVYVLVDKDGDGILERRKVCTVGDANIIIYDDVYDDDMVPFGTLCPDPEQHSPFGNSVFDWSKDIQEVKSELLRGALDSLAESITSSRAINKRTVNIDDALNPARGALIRVDGAPANEIFDLARPFAGQNILPVLAYMDEMKTRRTGINPASPTGLDMDALQSTAKEGVQAAVDASQDRTEMIARIFAETGFTRLFRGVRNLLVRHQDYRRVLRLMGKPTIVDPRSWVADLDVIAVVGTGRSNSAKRLQGLGMMLAQQTQIITTYGPANPIVTMEHFSYTLHEMARELGFSNPERFAKSYTPEMQQQAEAMAQAMASKPTPQELLYKAQSERNQVEAQKVQSSMQIKLLELAERRDAMIRQDATKANIANQQFALGAAKLLGEYGQAVENQAVALRGEVREDAHRLADDFNTDAAAERQSTEAAEERAAAQEAQSGAEPS